MDRNAVTGLTDDEQCIIEASVALWNTIASMSTLSGDDKRNAADAIHAIQRIITHVAFAAHYPLYWRNEG